MPDHIQLSMFKLYCKIEFESWKIVTNPEKCDQICPYLKYISTIWDLKMKKKLFINSRSCEKKGCPYIKYISSTWNMKYENNYN